MFGINRMFKLVAVVAASVMIVACGQDKEKVSAASENNMIPDNAVFALKIDAQQLWEKALGNPNSELRQTWNMAKSYVPMYAASLGEIGTIASDFVKDPSTLGIRPDQPVVVSFAIDILDVASEQVNVEVCLVALLDNSAAFVKAADVAMDLANKEAELGMTKEVVDDSYTYYSFSPERGVNVDMGVAEKSAVIRVKANTTKEAEDYKASMLSLFSNGGPAKTDGLDAFYASKGDVTMWMDMEGTLNMAKPAMEQLDPTAMAQLEEYMPMYKNASLVSTLEFQKGKTVLEAKVFGSEEMMAYTQKYNALSSDKYFESIPRSSVFVANFAMKDFAGLVKEISKTNPQFADGMEYLEEELGIDQELLEGFPGIITFALDGNGIGERQIPGMTLMMECEENVWEYAQQFLDEYATYDGYFYNIMDVCYVTYDGAAIRAFDAQTFKNGGSAGRFSRSPLAKDIAQGGFVLNLAALPYDVLDEVAEEIDHSMTGYELLEFIDSIVISSTPDQMTSTVTLNMGDKSENLLSKILSFAAESVRF